MVGMWGVFPEDRARTRKEGHGRTLNWKKEARVGRKMRLHIGTEKAEKYIEVNRGEKPSKKVRRSIKESK